MIIQQISVFVENQPGTLAEVLGVLAEHDVNIRALSVADTADFGILRLIVAQPEKVERVLRGAGFTAKITPVLTLTVTDQPGGLLNEINKLSAAGVNIEYIYAFAASSSETARVVIKVDDLDRAARLIDGEPASVPQPDREDGPNFYW